MQERDLSKLFEPTSVAVVGASDDPAKWGHWLARGALEGEHRRTVYLVNRRAAEVLGRPTYRSVEALPQPPELVVLCVPAESFDTAVDEALEKGAKAIVGITAGMAETGPDGARREAAVARRVREAGAVLLGPNCLGVIDSAAELHLAAERLPAGSIGLISQSGNLALELGVKAGDAGIGFARFASVGNQADLEVADLVAEFTLAPAVEVIAVYCEDFRDGRRFVEAAARATEQGKPVLLLAVGSSTAAARAARSHTGALVSGDSAVLAACRAAGIERVRTPKELVDTAQALMLGLLPRGRRVAVVGDGGGHGAVAADVTEAAGLEVPAFSAPLAARLGQATGTPGGTSNPVDLAGAGERDIWSFVRVVSALAESDEVDALLLTGYFGGYGSYSPEMAGSEAEVAAAIAALVTATGKPMVVHAMHRASAGFADANRPDGPLDRLRAGRLPIYPSVEEAVAAVARLARRAEALGRLRHGPALLERLRVGTPGSVSDPDVEDLVGSGYFAARTLLERSGFPFVPALRATDLDAARKAASELGYPVAVKAVGLEHKSDAGGVALGVSSDAELEAVVRDFLDRFAGTVLSVESMAPGGVELLVGAVRDPRFGPVVLAGFGGIYTEVLRDTAVALAPVGREEAEELILSLQASPLLLGARGRAALDVAAAAEALVVLSEVAARHPRVNELEVNPLLVAREGAYGLDARVVLESPEATAAAGP